MSMMAEWLFARDMKEMMGEITVDGPTKKSCCLAITVAVKMRSA